MMSTNHGMSRNWWAVAGFLCAAALSTASTAQDVQPQESRFSGSVRVDVVEVEVFVTDSQGMPVYGLDREDFHLRPLRSPPSHRELWSRASRLLHGGSPSLSTGRICYLIGGLKCWRRCGHFSTSGWRPAIA